MPIATVLRWFARIISILLIISVTAFVVAEKVNLLKLSENELLLITLFIIGLLAQILALYKEALGGIISLIFLSSFVILSGLYQTYIGILLVGTSLLYVISWLFRKFIIKNVFENNFIESNEEKDQKPFSKIF
jgi:hypothetical protein